MPVTGANDSYFILHIVKNKLNLNPLLVSYNKYFNTPLGIRNLSNLRIKFNCDILIQNVNPKSVKKITKETFRRFGNIYWPCIAGQTVFPVQTAIRYKIPLIIWGAHQGVEQVGMFSHTNEVEMSRRYRKDHDLMGFEADDLISIDNTLNEEDLWQYRYPTDYELNQNSIRGIYLSNYIRWDPKSQHEEMVEKYNFQSSSFSRTFDTYDFVDCFNYMDIHDQLKFYKHGYSKVTDHACREIRFKRIDRKQALYLVNNFQFKKLQFEHLFSEWLGIPIDSLSFIKNQFRNKIFWEEYENGKWKFKNNEEQKNKKIFIELAKEGKFKSTHSINLDMVPKYITVGKGFP